MPAVLTVAWKSFRLAELSGNFTVTHAPAVVGMIVGTEAHVVSPGVQDTVTSGQAPEDISVSASSFKPKSSDFRLLVIA